MPKLKVGLVGVGYLGEFHLQKLLKIQEAEFIGFFEPDRERARFLKETYRVSSFGDLLSLIKEIDACVVAAPTSKHYELTKALLLSGKHVLVEKPICEVLEEAEELVFLSKEKGLVLQVGHVERFNPAIKKLLSMVQGPFYFESRREMPPAARSLVTDVAMDLLIHDIDILLKMAQKEPYVVDVKTVSRIQNDCDFLSCWLKFDDGSKAHLTSSRISPQKTRTIRVLTEDGFYVVDCNNRSFEEVLVVRECLEINLDRCEYESTDPLMEEDSHFVRSVCRGETPLVPGEDALRALKVIHDIRKKARESPQHWCEARS